MKKNTKIITVAVIILVCSLLSGCQESSQKAKDTKKQNIIADKQKENSKVEETTQNENIREGEAKDDNDLTGTYVDEESGETLKVVVKDGKASFCLYSKDGEEYSDFKEKDRDIKDNYIDGEMSYVSKNMDGSLAVSSGSGGSWGKFVKKEKGAKIDFTNFNSSDRLEKETYQESDGIKIDKDKINNKVLKFENDDGELCFTYLDDDGSYFDEIVSGAWYDENGAPLAKMPPLNLWRKGHLWTGDLNDFHFVNPKGFTMDQLKRTNPSDDMEGDLYVIILKNITKEQGDDNMIYYGEDYYTGEEVMFRGKYSKILNGDNVLIIGQFIGLTEDDSPELDVWRVELCNDRF